MEESSKLAVKNSTTELTIKPQKKKKKKLAVILIIILFCSFLYALFYYNVYFRLFPQHLLPYALSNTWDEIDKETKAIDKVITKNIEATGLEKFNRYNFSCTGLNAELSNFDDLSKGYLSFSDAIKINFYVDDSEFLFNVNNSDYYYFDFIHESGVYESGADLHVAKDEYLTNVEMTFDNAVKSIEEVFNNLFGSKDNIDALWEIITENSQVMFGEDTTKVLLTYKTDDIYDITSYIYDNFDHKIEIAVLNFYIETLTKDSENVFITYTIDNYGKHKNQITKLNITTDSNSGRYFQIEAPTEESLIMDVIISSKFVLRENITNVKTTFEEETETFTIQINDHFFDIDFDIENQNLIIQANENTFLKISDDFSEPKKPKIKTHLTDTEPIPFLLDIIGVDISPITKFYDALIDVIG